MGLLRRVCLNFKRAGRLLVGWMGLQGVASDASVLCLRCFCVVYVHVT